MNNRMSLLLFVLGVIGLMSYKTIHTRSSGIQTPAKFRVTILYPNGDDKTFDMDYYEKKHMPMVAGFIGSNLVRYEIDKGISGRSPGERPPFIAVGYFYVNDITAYQNAIAQNRDAVISDFKNYTNIQPVVQVNEVMQVIRPRN
jgi:uncharacterized protein (TIGR02118 family)